MSWLTDDELTLRLHDEVNPTECWMLTTLIMRAAKTAPAGYSRSHAQDDRSFLSVYARNNLYYPDIIQSYDYGDIKIDCLSLAFVLKGRSASFILHHTSSQTSEVSRLL